MPSFYQDDLFGELAKKVDLRVVYDHRLTDDRRQLGWAEPAGGYRTCFLTAGRKIGHSIKIARAEMDRIHLVNGIWAEPAFMAASFAFARANARFAIYAECPDKSVPRSILRRRAQAAIGHWVARRATGLFAVSHFAVDYFRELGFHEENIYPFGYFRRTLMASREPNDDMVRLIYIGQLIRRKGIDILLDAMAPLWSRFPHARLSVIGVGPESSSLVAKVQADALQGRVTFEGARASSEIQQLLARASILILPSRWDGWGLVINEALSAGVPVIASNRCGAADLIVHGANGYVFRSEDVDSLRRCLAAFLTSAGAQMRTAALRTGSAVAIPLVADYLVACLEHMCGLTRSKPFPPWTETLRLLESESRDLPRNDHESLAGAQTPEQRSV